MITLINWFEIPVHDLERAVTFYQEALGVTLRRETVAGIEMAIFPHTKPATGGALVKGELFTPSQAGAVVYLATPDLATTLECVAALGGACSVGPVVLPHDIGTIALIIDCEGNRVGLHQPA